MKQKHGPPNPRPKPKSLATAAAELKRKMAMKAYVVSDDEVSIIVFETTPGKAKSFAKGRELFFESCEYLDLSARREPQADRLALPDPYILNFCKNASFYVELDWYCSSDGGCDRIGCPMMERQKEFI